MGKSTKFSAFIKSRREKIGLTQEQLANRLNLRTGEFISLIEAGKRNLDLNRTPELARALGVDPKGLVRAALYEQYPSAFVALFGEERPADIKEVDPLHPQAVILEPDMLALLRRLVILPKPTLKLVADMIGLLAAGTVGTQDQI